MEIKKLDVKKEKDGIMKNDDDAVYVISVSNIKNLWNECIDADISDDDVLKIKQKLYEKMTDIDLLIKNIIYGVADEEKEFK